jgi:SNF2 family DNA or RNA helicase
MQLIVTLMKCYLFILIYVNRANNIGEQRDQGLISASQNPNNKKKDGKQQDYKLKDEALFFDDLEDNDNSSENDVDYQPTSRRVGAATTTTTTSNKRKTTTDIPNIMASMSSSKKEGINVEYNSSTRKSGSSCRDDLELWEYEDRVGLWIESGVSNMVSLPYPSEVLPGEARFPGGLTIPAWINNRLFPYQRSALRWLWELYKQKSGSILGDEMGLVGIFC